jgi:hypothetical protein
MKNLPLLFICLLLISIGCKKEEKAASPSTTTPVTLSYTSADSAISGNWILDLYEVYSAGALVGSTPHSDPVNCHLDLQLTQSTISGSAPDWKTCIYGLSCTNSVNQWRLNSGMLELNGGLYLWTIVSQSATNLVIQLGSMSVGTASKCYLHK